ncbi:MAG: potassium channel family protein [Neomegalonema sp.]|nr:potassium channel family protein [Neomegalonema sp.]
MPVNLQILLGSLVLALCGGVHVWALALGARLLHRIARASVAKRGILHSFKIVGAAFAIIVFAHSAEVWIWAFALAPLSDFADLEKTLYFALVTYTTLGYGDVVLGPDARIFAAMSSVTGLLTFGLSTAFLAAALANLPAFKIDDEG